MDLNNVMFNAIGVIVYTFFLLIGCFYLVQLRQGLYMLIPCVWVCVLRGVKSSPIFTSNFETKYLPRKLHFIFSINKRPNTPPNETRSSYFNENASTLINNL
jgi:hypothetical protein